MFGEHDSESPRVPSPWDPFLPSPPSSLEANKQFYNGIPKLVPEVEEGNVEYKLKLTHISPARFARLVTQLKWRLLEGGGQAYYELGVADSGALVGLSRADLEQSLATLDTMAGEIGASVIVVKEIEVPHAMVALAEESGMYLDPDTGGWARKMRKGVPILSEDESATETTETEPETEFSTADSTDVDDVQTSNSNWPHAPSVPRSASFAHRLTSHPARPSAQSSPYIAPLDDDLALFSMEPEPSHLTTDTDSDITLVTTPPDASAFSIDLEIASVYKPRPARRRTQAAGALFAVPFTGKHARRQKYKEKQKQQPWHAMSNAAAAIESKEALTKEAKAMHRRIARDQRREEKRKAYLDSAVASDVPAETEELAHALDALHVTVESTNPVGLGAQTLSKSPQLDVVPSNMEEAQASAGATGTNDKAAREPRLIVEALVVRKMSIEEAFLDFGGFQLV
ncbi:hypothetical protein WOLCODRAFT_137625 [Wolfiporia cocos MD-104 SS10]|uniref:GTP-binding protein 2 n=1 Tax=Wolfiporia cocos (strain MD-104) TaxID=742152 RepID=A0A2H3JK76_WOLCO|nr:hypothetical protein WOLCODRAFT_137625 [Wolfiporia cocos MD-104 SS10]